MKFVLHGDIGQLSLIRSVQDRSWDKKKHLSRHFQTQLEDQYKEKAPFTVPFSLEVNIFHIDTYIGKEKLREMGIGFLDIVPENKLWVFRHVDVIDHILYGILYTNRELIISLAVKKMYDIHPRIEIDICTAKVIRNKGEKSVGS